MECSRGHLCKPHHGKVKSLKSHDKDSVMCKMHCNLYRGGGRWKSGEGVGRGGCVEEGGREEELGGEEH